MTFVPLMISNGADTNKYRDCARGVIGRLQQMFVYKLGVDLQITEWDYRWESPAVVPAGTMAARSLAVVNMSAGIAAILGPSIPRIASKEIRETVERIKRGEPVELWLFVDSNEYSDLHKRFLGGIKNRYGFELSFQPFEDEVTFQAALFTTLFPYLLRHTGIFVPGIA